MLALARLLLAARVLALGVPPVQPTQGAQGAPATQDGAAVALAPIPVQIVQGKLVVACQLSANKRISANLFLDLEAPVGLVLHNQAVRGIEAIAEDGTPSTVTVHLPDLQIPVERIELGELEPYEKFTKWYSKELGENAVVGTLGAKVLRGFSLTLDVGAGILEIGAPKARTDDELPTPRGSFRTPISEFNQVCWARVQIGERTGVLGLGTIAYDTIIDRDLCEELAKPAGDVGPLTLGEVDIAKYVALRPEEIRHRHPEGVVGITGLNLLKHFKVEIDRTNRSALWTPTAPPSFPTADWEFFRARTEERAEALELWLAHYPKERLAPEAAERVLDLQIEKGAAPEKIHASMKVLLSTRPEDLQSTAALDLLQRMSATARPDLALLAGELGLVDGRKDRYPDAVHKIHGRMGRILLDRGRGKDAWKHLLSAAFGLPDDGPINLDLGRYYEQEQRFTRAFSRYLQALLSAESSAAAAEGLERVQPKLQEVESFSVDRIEKRIEGKIEGFGVASKYKIPEGEEPPTRTVLAELYTNAHFKPQIGAALAADGLRDHFSRKQLILLTYHIAEPRLEPLVNELSAAMGSRFSAGQPSHWLDGASQVPRGGLSRFKQQIFDVCASRTAARLEVPADHDLTLEAKLEGRRISGKLTLFGNEAENGLVQIFLVERGVLFCGKSGVVIQRWVVRGSLTKSLLGEPYRPERAFAEVDFGGDLGEIEKRNGRWLDAQMEAGLAQVPKGPVRIDDRQVSIVAVLRNGETGEVYQCTFLDLAAEEAVR
ncbi:MAG: hypothetical protein JNJ88_15345 [Planctomycetes bacterium]|nr:hypothetical protein [Planctomycetota bacterium]